MVTQLERRATSAAYRVVTNEGEAQYRALSRLGSIAGEEVAWDVWLSTKPDPELVKKVMDRLCGKEYCIKMVGSPQKA